MFGAAIGVGIGGVRDARQQRAESAALHRFTRSQRQRAQGAAVKRPRKCDQPFAPGVKAGELDGRFDRFGSRVAEKDAVVARARNDFRELLRQQNLIFVVEIRPRHVNQARRLLLHGGDHARVAMAGGDDGNTRREIQKAVAIDIFNEGTLAAARHQWIAACVRGRNVAAVELEDFSRLGARQVRADRYPDRGIDGVERHGPPAFRRRHIVFRETLV